MNSIYIVYHLYLSLDIADDRNMRLENCAMKEECILAT